MNKSTETPKRTEALLDAYKAKEEVETVLDPKAISKSTLDKLPTPTGYRILVLPYAGPKKTKGGILLSDTTQETIQMTTVCGLVLKVGIQVQDSKLKVVKLEF
jgi:hypothetical protein